MESNISIGKNFIMYYYWTNILVIYELHYINVISLFAHSTPKLDLLVRLLGCVIGNIYCLMINMIEDI